MIPDEIMKRYQLYGLQRSCFVYFEIRRCMYGLPQAGRLSQLRLIEHLARHGYHQCPNTPCLFRHRQFFYTTYNSNKTGYLNTIV